jgi:sulfopropanediol 3-dehydrogenase
MAAAGYSQTMAAAKSFSYIKTGAVGTSWGPGGVPRATGGSGAEAVDPKVMQTVQGMMDEIARGGEDRVKQYCKELDKWEGSIVLSAAEIEAKCDRVPEQTKQDIQFAAKQVKAFAEAQLASLTNFEKDIGEGVTAGQRVMPMTTAGCYAPGGRYSHIASAIMSVMTARTSGVKNVILCSPPKNPTEGIDDAIVYAGHYCGADTIMTLGGVQAIASLRFGLFTGLPADILVGPGNIYVATAKRLSYGAVAIDMFAGPTEIGIIADSKADAKVVAVDIMSQVEHGPTSPAWLITTDRTLGEKVAELVPKEIEDLPEPNRSAARDAWRDYGEIVLADNREDAVIASDLYAPEHLEVQCEDLDWWLTNLKNYGSLFLGEEVTVTHGDKSSGPNHTLPTMGASKYTGGLSVHKFLKVVTFQRATQAASHRMGVVSARISRAERMEGHARAADVRINKYAGAAAGVEKL